MEDALRGDVYYVSGNQFDGLNPCSNGRCSARHNFGELWSNCNSLNPCSNGRCSARGDEGAFFLMHNVVLILVLMEDALRVC